MVLCPVTHAHGRHALWSLAAIWIRTLPLEAGAAKDAKDITVCTRNAGLVIAIGGIDFHSIAMTVFGFPVLAATFACLLLLALQDASLVNRLGKITGLRFIGRYSYGMYVYHILFWRGLSVDAAVVADSTALECTGRREFCASHARRERWFCLWRATNCMRNNG